MSEHTIEELQQMQALPLDIKMLLTRERIRAWIKEYGENHVYISFSGGKDSTVLLDLVRNEFGYKNVPACFVDVPTQYPELRSFVKTFDNVDIVTPKINFFQVCEKYGFPLFSKEISECVQGARKYLTSILNEQNALTDRQTDRPYRYWYERVQGIGKYEKVSYQFEWWKINGCKGRYGKTIPSRGGYDAKYRRLQGIGEFVEREKVESDGWQQSTISDHVRTSNRERRDKGEYP